MKGAGSSTESPPSPALDVLLRAEIDRNGLLWGVLRFALVAAMTVFTTWFAFAKDLPQLRAHLWAFYGETLITAVGCWLVVRSAWWRQRIFVFLPLVDIPVITVERWFFVPHSPRPENSAMLEVIWMIALIVLAQFSLNRRVVVATTAAAMASAVVVNLRVHTLVSFIGVSVITIAASGWGAWLLVGHAFRLMRTLAERSDELRRLLAHVESAREEERSRLSHNLHDELGQELSALSLALAYTVRRASAEPGNIQQNLTELDRLLAQTRHTVRGIVTELRPRVLDDLGFRAGLEWLVQRARHRALECELLFEGTDEVESRVAEAAFRVLQEALTNVVRHAQAKHVKICLTTNVAGLDLVVADDGVGFVPQAVEEAQRRGGGMGLVGMRERAEEVGGEVSVSPRAPAGTEVRLQVRAVKA